MFSLPLGGFGGGVTGFSLPLGGFGGGVTVFSLAGVSTNISEAVADCSDVASSKTGSDASTGSVTEGILTPDVTDDTFSCVLSPNDTTIIALSAICSSLLLDSSPTIRSTYSRSDIRTFSCSEG